MYSVSNRDHERLWSWSIKNVSKQNIINQSVTYYNYYGLYIEVNLRNRWTMLIDISQSTFMPVAVAQW